YVPQRKEALETAKTGLGDLAGVYQQAAQSGDPAQILKALGTGESGGKIRSDLNLPPEIAREVGVQPGLSSWSQMTPEQFSNFLRGIGRNDPGVLNSWVVGSGDVPYLPQHLAQQAADQAANDARSLLTFMVAKQQEPQSGPVEQAPVAPSATTPGGGGP